MNVRFAGPGIALPLRARAAAAGARTGGRARAKTIKTIKTT
jgi:hypothetical protein